MSQMFLDWVVVFLPAIEASTAKETGGIVGVRGGWVVVETRMCKLVVSSQSIELLLTVYRQEQTSAGEGLL